MKEKCFLRQKGIAWYIQKIPRNSELLDHKITEDQVEGRMVGAKGKALSKD